MVACAANPITTALIPRLTKYPETSTRRFTKVAIRTAKISVTVTTFRAVDALRAPMSGAVVV